MLMSCLVMGRADSNSVHACYWPGPDPSKCIRGGYRISERGGGGGGGFWVAVDHLNVVHSCAHE